MKNLKIKRYTGFATVDLLIAIAIAAALTGVVVYQISSPVALNITGMSCSQEQQLAANVSACGLAYMASGGSASTACTGINTMCPTLAGYTAGSDDATCTWNVGDAAGVAEVTLAAGVVTVNCTNDM